MSNEEKMMIAHLARCVAELGIMSRILDSDDITRLYETTEYFTREAEPNN